MPNEETLSGSLIITDDAFDSITKYEQRLGELDKTIDSFISDSKRRFNDLGQTIKDSIPPVMKMRLDVDTSSLKKLEEISRMATELNRTGVGGASGMSATEKEAKINQSIADSLGKRADTYAAITQRIREMRNAKAQLQELEDRAPEGFSLSEQSIDNYMLAEERIASLQERVRLLGLEYDSTRAKSHLDLAVSMPEGNIEQVKNKLIELKKAKEEFLKPGTSGSESDRTAGMMEVQSAIDSLIPKYRKLSDAAKENAKAQREAQKEAQKLSREQNKIAAAETKLSDALGLGEGDVASIKEKMRSIRSSITELRSALKNPVGGTTEIRNAQAEYDRLKVKLEELKGGLKDTGDAASSAGRMFAQAFSVYTVTRLLREVVDIYGQFQMTERSLGVIIGDTVKARDIFNEIKSIAIKSPFQVSDLADYTKQLAAFRIETDDLISKTNMLGDLSAGLGVEMGRLILAYGQVRSANYLKLTEVRQFTEGGVDLLGGLADKFSEIEKRAVTVGEVMNRITKRMVTFKDVDDVLTKMTSAGGTFYQMQKQQAETVMGLISNLRDRWEIAMNEMGSNSDSMIRGVITMITNLIDHAQTLEVVLKSALWGYAVGMSVKMLISGVNGAITAIRNLRRAFLAISAESTFANLAKSANVYAAAIGVAVSAFAAYVLALRKYGELKRELADIDRKSIDEQNELISKYSLLTTRLNDNTKSVKERKDILEELKVTFGNILPLENASIDNIRELNDAYSEHIEIMRAYAVEKSREEKRLTLTEKLMDKADKQFANFQIDSMREQGNLFDLMRMKNISTADLEENVRVIFESFQTRILAGERDLLNLLQNDTRGLSKALGNEIAEWFGISEQAKNWNWEELDVLLEPYINAKDELISIYRESRLPALSFETQDVEKEIAGIKADYERYLGDLLAMPEFKDNRAAAVERAQQYVKGVVEGITGKIEGLFAESKIGPELKKNLERRLNSAYASVDLSRIEEILNKRFDEINRKLPGLKFPMGEGVTLWSDTAQIDDYTKAVTEARDSLVALIKSVKNAEGAADSKTEAGIARTALAWEQLGYDSIDSANRQVKAYNMLLAVLPEISKEKVTKKSPNKAAKETQDSLKELGNALVDYYKVMDSVNPAVLKAKWDKILAINAKLALKLPDKNNLTEKSIQEWLDNSLKPLLDDKTVHAEINVKFQEVISSKSEESLRKAADEIKKKIQFALEFDRIGIRLEGLDTASLYGQLEEVASQMSEIPTESATKSAGDIANFMKNIYGDAQQNALREIAALNRKSAEGMAKLFEDYKKSMANIANLNAKSDATGLTVPDTFIDSSRLNATKVLLKGIDDEMWSLYKSTEMYIRSFGNLDGIDVSVLEQLRSQLKSMAESQRDLKPTDAKALSNALSSLDEAIADRRFSSTGYFDTLVRGMKSVKAEYDLISPSLEKASSEQAKFSEALARYEKMKSQQEQNPEAFTDEQMQQAVDELTDATENYNKALADYFNQVNRTKNATQQFKTKMSSLKEGVAKVGDAIGDVVSFTQSVASIFGDVFGDETEAALDGIQKGFDLMGQGIAAASTVMIALELGLWGADAAAKSLMATLWPLLVAALALSAALAVIQAADKAKQKEVEKQKDKVEELRKEYDKLEEAMEQALSIERLREYNTLLDENLQNQKNALEAALKAEQSRGGKADDETIKDLKEQLAELDEAAEETKEKLMSALGVDTDWAGQAGDFASAWLAAFNESGDGLQALSDSFDEFWNNMIAAQIKYQVFGSYFDRLKANVEGWLSDMKIDAFENEQIQNMRNELYSLNEQAKAFMETLGLGSGIAETSTTTLKGDIANISESQAGAIEGYLNSVRFYVAQIYQLQADYIASQRATADSPMLTELRSQTEIARRIEALFTSITKEGHRDGGPGIKVFMD